jgi:hypothetical protein
VASCGHFELVQDQQERKKERKKESTGWGNYCIVVKCSCSDLEKNFAIEKSNHRNHKKMEVISRGSNFK